MSSSEESEDGKEFAAAIMVPDSPFNKSTNTSKPDDTKLVITMIDDGDSSKKPTPTVAATSTTKQTFTLSMNTNVPDTEFATKA